MLRFLRQNRTQRLASNADKARDAHQWRNSARLYREYLEYCPDDFDRWVQCGHAEKESGRLDRALSCYLRALSIDESNADLHLQLGHLYKVMGQLDVAAAYYKQARAFCPDNDDAERELRELAPHISLQGLDILPSEEAGSERSRDISDGLSLPAATLVDATRLTALLHKKRQEGATLEQAVILRALARLSPLRVDHWAELANILEDLGDLEQSERCRAIIQSIEGLDQ